MSMLKNLKALIGAARESDDLAVRTIYLARARVLLSDATERLRVLELNIKALEADLVKRVKAGSNAT